MKKKFILICCFLFINLQVSANGFDEIEIENQKCLDSGYNMPNCNYVSIQKYEIEIENILKKFKKVLNETQYLKIDKSQKKWIDYKKNQYDLYEEIFDTVPAQIMHLIGTGYKKQIVKNRAEELFDLYKTHMFLKEEYPEYYKK